MCGLGLCANPGSPHWWLATSRAWHTPVESLRYISVPALRGGTSFRAGGTCGTERSRAPFPTRAGRSCGRVWGDSVATCRLHCRTLLRVSLSCRPSVAESMRRKHPGGLSCASSIRMFEYFQTEGAFVAEEIRLPWLI